MGDTLRQWLDSVLGKALAFAFVALAAGLGGGQLERVQGRADVEEEVRAEVGDSIDQLEADALRAAEKLDKKKRQLEAKKTESLDLRAVLEFMAAKYEADLERLELRNVQLSEHCLSLGDLATDAALANEPAPLPVSPPTVSRKTLEALPQEQRALIPEVQAKE